MLWLPGGPRLTRVARRGRNFVETKARRQPRWRARRAGRRDLVAEQLPDASAHVIRANGGRANYLSARARDIAVIRRSLVQACHLFHLFYQVHIRLGPLYAAKNRGWRNPSSLARIRMNEHAAGLVRPNSTRKRKTKTSLVPKLIPTKRADIMRLRRFCGPWSAALTPWLCVPVPCHP